LFVAVGIGPSAIVSADFNHNGRTDLAVANSMSDSVSILLGDGHGRFPQVSNFPVLRRPSFLMTGEMDSDRRIDLIVGNDHDEHVSILKGQSEGLLAPTVGEMGTKVRPLVSEDFNQDGQIDLAVTNEAEDRVSILLGMGENAFGDPISFPVGRHPVAIAAGDFNGDHLVDLAVVNRGSRTVMLLMNTSTHSVIHTIPSSPLLQEFPHKPSDPWDQGAPPGRW
jgi:hypothetical protein